MTLANYNNNAILAEDNPMPVKNINIHDKVVIAKDGTYIKFYKDTVLVKQLDFSSDATDDIIEAVDPANYKVYDFKLKNITSPSVPVVLIGGWAVDGVTGKSIDLIDNSGGTLFNAPDHVVAYSTSGGGGATAAEVWTYGTRALSTTGVTAIQSGLATTGEYDTQLDDIETAIGGISGGLTPDENVQLMKTLTVGKFIALK